ncbi:UDP-N-acetylglucosamine 1-carboxyvinyltransferase [bacterium]|nr:UDP-N-acetylglucosamine 1-carboxyvinyltransferase [bacterium]
MKKFSTLILLQALTYNLTAAGHLATAPNQPSARCTDVIAQGLFPAERPQPQAVYDEKLALQGTGQKIITQGPFVLEGSVKVDVAKNAILPILTSVLLHKGPVDMVDLPNISDVDKLTAILKDFGVQVSHPQENVTRFDSSNLHTNRGVCELSQKMRASFIVLGSLLGRFGAAEVFPPGGCVLGARGFDYHIDAFQKMGVVFEDFSDGAPVRGTSSAQKLHSAEIELKGPSVGATQNILNAAVLTEGVSRIKNAAQEAEVHDMVNFLNSMGAKIEWINENTIEITGVKELKSPPPYRAIGDRIEAGTYILMGLMNRTELKVEGFNPEHLGKTFFDVLDAINATYEVGKDFVIVKPSQLKPVTKLNGEVLHTAPHPGFPTDLQAPLIALLTTIDGESRIVETVFEDRLQIASELNKLIPDSKNKIRISTHKMNGKEHEMAIIPGSSKMSFHWDGSAPAKATDLRAAAALVMAASRSDGPVEINNIIHLFRGYARFLEHLKARNVDISVVDEVN